MAGIIAGAAKSLAEAAEHNPESVANFIGQMFVLGSSESDRYYPPIADVPTKLMDSFIVDIVNVSNRELKGTTISLEKCFGYDSLFSRPPAAIANISKTDAGPIIASLENIPGSSSDHWRARLLVMYGADLSKCTAYVNARTETVADAKGEHVTDTIEYLNSLSSKASAKANWVELGWKSLVTIGLIWTIMRLNSLRKIASAEPKERGSAGVARGQEQGDSER